MNQYTAQTLVRMTAMTTKTADSAPVDPSAWTVKLKLPDASIVDLSSDVQHDGFGLFHVDYTPLLIGLYIYEWIFSGSVVAARQRQFLVNQGTF